MWYMKQNIKRVLSVIMVIAIMLSLTTFAFAAGERVTISAPANNASLVIGDTGTAAAVCSCGGDKIIFSSSASDVLSFDGNKYTANKVGTAVIKATCDIGTCGAENTVTVTVKCNANCDVDGCACTRACNDDSCACTACTTPAVTMDRASVTVALAGTSAVKATVAYPDCSGLSGKAADIAWTVVDNTIASISAESGESVTVTGVKEGKTTLTATYTDSAAATRTAYKTIEITVNPKEPTVSAQSKVLYALVGDAAAMKVTATSNGTTKIDTGLSYQWYSNSTASNSGGTKIAGAVNVEFKPANYTTAGTYYYYCEVTDTVNGCKSTAVSGVYTIKVYDKYTVELTQANGTESIAVGSGVLLKAVLTENTVDSQNTSCNTKPVSDGTINWTVDNSAAQFKSGTGYVSYKNSATDADGVSAETVYGKTIKIDGVTVTAAFTYEGVRYSDTYTVKVQDEIEITTGGDTATVPVKTTSEAAKVTGVKDITANKKAELFVKDKEITSDYYYKVSYSSEDASIAKIDADGIITGVKTGITTVKATVTVYKSNGDASTDPVVSVKEKSCKVTVTSGSFDVYYNIVSNGTLTLEENDFSTWFRQKTNSAYYMNYITLDGVSEAFGTFKNNSATFAPDGSVKYYNGGSSVENAKFIDSITYTAADGAYYITVPFTCYGGSTATSENVTASGTMYICVTKGVVNDVKYDVSKVSKQPIAEKDFYDVYKTATGKTVSTDAYYVQLLDATTKGALYLNYTDAENTGTELKKDNIGSYNFYVNKSDAETKISDLTYIPSSTSISGVDLVCYAAFDSSGKLMYIGVLNFEYDAFEFTSYSDGYTFKLKDFYNEKDADPIVAISFVPTDDGCLYYNYKNGSGTEVKGTDLFFTKDTINGAYDIKFLTYIPAADKDSSKTGNVEISYVATTKSGKTYDGTITIKVLSKTASTQFTDVNVGSSSWAANSIDFAYAWGLVNGTDTRTFSPKDSMTRAMLVTVLYRAAGSPEVSGSTAFTDLNSKQYYYNAVLWAAQNKIVEGVTPTTFCPNDEVTREQIATLLYRFAKFSGYDVSTSSNLAGYKDISKVHVYAVDSVKWAVGSGIIKSASTTESIIDPLSSATRAQVVSMLHRYLAG